MDTILRVPKEKGFQADWRTDVAHGADHPLKHELDYDEWHLTWCVVISVDSSQTLAHSRYNWTEDEKEFLQLNLSQPKLQWLLDNSFDGLYFKRWEDFPRAATRYEVGAYLQGKHATFWKLKYGNLP